MAPARDGSGSRERRVLRLIGDHRRIEAFPAGNLAHPRDLVVLLPRSYHGSEATRKRYPVLYMQDGNNLFDPVQAFGGVDWGLDEAIDGVTAAGEIP